MKKPSDSFSKASRSASGHGGASGIRAGSGCFSSRPAQHPEEARLAGLAVPLALLPRLHRAVDGGEERGAPRVDGVEGPALDEALHHSPVHGPQVHAVAEVEERAEGPALPAGGEHRLDRALPDVLDGGEAEADVVSPSTFVRVGVRGNLGIGGFLGTGQTGCLGTTVKNISDWFTSGGSTRMPISRHSPMYCTILSVFARSEVRRAAMKYAG